MAPGNNQVTVDIILRLLKQGDVDSAIKKVKKLTDDQTSAIVKNTKATTKQTSTVKKFEKAVKEQGSAIDKAAKSTKHIKVITDDYGNSVGVATHTTNRLVDAQGRNVVVTGAVSTQLKKLTTWQKLSSGMWISHFPVLDKMNKAFNNLRWTMVNVAFALGAIAIVLAPFALIAKHAIAVETAMVGVAKTTGLSKTRIAELREEFYDLSAILPISVQELAEIGKVAGQLGIKGKDIGKFTKAIAMISLVTDLTAEEAATSFAKIASAFDTPIESVLQLGNILNELENTTAATTENLVNGLTRVGAAATTMGISFEVSAAAVATLVSSGMRAERAGTRLRALYTKMAQNSEEFAAIAGVPFEKFSETLRTDADEALRQVIIGLSKATNGADALKEGTEAAGLVAGFALASLARNVDDFERNLQSANDELEDGNSILEETIRQLDTTANAWQQFKNVFVGDTEGLGRTISEKMLKPVLQGLTRMISGNIQKRVVQQQYELANAFAVGLISAEKYYDVMGQVSELQKTKQFSTAELILASAIDEAGISVEEAGEKVTTVLSKFDSLQEAYLAYAEAASALDTANITSIDVLEELEEAIELVKEKTLLSHTEDDYKRIERMYSINKKLSGAINEVGMAQKNAAAFFAIANKKLSNEISDLNKKYTDYRKARFIGEQGQLDNLHEIELAIKKERLEQLKLNDTIDATNDALLSNQDSFTAWVDTVKTFIRETLSAGVDLGKNVSRTIGQFSTLLLSTSKFTNEQKKEADVVDELQKKRDIAQLEYEIGIGEQRYQLNEYINELERRGQVELQTADQAIIAVGAVKSELDTLRSKQEVFTNKWNDAKNAVTLFQLGFENATDFINDNVDSQILRVEDLIRAYEKLGRTSGVRAGGVSSVGAAQDEARTRASTDRGTGSYVVTTGTGEKITRYNDFIARPGEKPIGFSPSDTIVGFNGKGPIGMGGVTIENINISGVSGDPAEFAYTFAEELRRELRTI